MRVCSLAFCSLLQCKYVNWTNELGRTTFLSRKCTITGGRFANENANANANTRTKVMSENAEIDRARSFLLACVFRWGVSVGNQNNRCVGKRRRPNATRGRRGEGLRRGRGAEGGRRLYWRLTGGRRGGGGACWGWAERTRRHRVRRGAAAATDSRHSAACANYSFLNAANNNNIHGLLLANYSRTVVFARPSKRRKRDSRRPCDSGFSFIFK